MASLGQSEDERAASLNEAIAIVHEWERGLVARFLSKDDEALLANRIARAIDAAYERGRTSRTSAC
jgi:hypothetical protein